MYVVICESSVLASKGYWAKGLVNNSPAPLEVAPVKLPIDGDRIDDWPFATWLVLTRRKDESYKFMN